jgi:hypothetical protein
VGHWTYRSFDATSDLEQGDLLAPTESLKALVRERAAGLRSDDSLGFMIATQSCDLVRRKRGAAVDHHISIVPVFSLRAVLPELLMTIAEPVAPGIFPTGSKYKAKQLLERLFDQNEQKLGLFYFHPDADLGLGESAVAYLRVKVPLEGKHYAVLVDAVRGRLDPEFRAKCGWLLGNLYARAASPDWADRDGGKKQRDALIAKYLGEQIPGAGPVWIEDEVIAAGQTARIDFSQERRALLAQLEAVRPRPRISQVVEAAINEVVGLVALDEEQKKKLQNRLLNNAQLEKLVGG